MERDWQSGLSRIWNNELVMRDLEHWQDDPSRHLPNPEIVMNGVRVKLNREAPDVSQLLNYMNYLLNCGIPEETVLLSIRCMQIRNPDNLTLKGVLRRLEKQDPSESIYDMNKITSHIRTMVREQEDTKTNPLTEIQQKARKLFVEATDPRRYQFRELAKPVRARFAEAALKGLELISGQDRKSLLGFNPDHYECNW